MEPQSVERQTAVLAGESNSSTAGKRPAASARAMPANPSWPDEFRQRGKVLAGLTLLLVAAFAKPLYDLVRFALRSDLFSHILLVPAISLYLVWMRRTELALNSAPVRRLAVFPLLAGLALLAGYGLAAHSGWKPDLEDYLALMTFSFLLLLSSALCLSLGRPTLRAIAFPIAFLIFMVPFPQAVHHWIESFLQHGSADAAYALLRLSGMPVYRQDTVFQLPDISLEVAPQCSGIHSSLVLFVTSLLGSYLLLRRAWTRAVFVLAVIPLGMLRNGFRIFTLGQLCVHVGPEMLDSPLHRRGGPLFFVVSLVPLFWLLWYLRKRERPLTPAKTH